MSLSTRASAAIVMVSTGLATASGLALSPVPQSNGSFVVVAGTSGAISVHDVASAARSTSPTTTPTAC